MRAEACRSLEQLRFPHAFDPLARVYRESTDAQACQAALRALAHVDTDEAAELVLGVLQHGGPNERAQAAAALSSSRGERFVRIAKASLSQATGEYGKALREVLRARGVRA